MSKDKVRKPDELLDGQIMVIQDGEDYKAAIISRSMLTLSPTACRQFAAWLTQAAAWIEQQEAKETQP